MRTLKFIVEGQKIEKDSACDFSGLVPGTTGYLRAEFSFSEEYKGCAKIAEFRKYLSADPIPVKIENDACNIPEEILTGSKFSVSVIGIRPGYRIPTNKVEVRQDG